MPSTTSASAAPSSPPPPPLSSSSSSLSFPFLFPFKSSKNEIDLIHSISKGRQFRIEPTNDASSPPSPPSPSSPSPSPPSILACSVSIKRELLGRRTHLADKKQRFEHLYPYPLTFSTVRVGIIQSGQVVTTFMTDQLEYESANEELVVQGKITPSEADRRNACWELIQWKEQWENFPKRYLQAILKLQSSLLLMRFYEHMASLMVTTKTLDRLTKDPFKSAKRKAERYENEPNTMYLVGRKMFGTCLWANAIGFLSDCTVQQCILFLGYFVYYRNRRQSMKQRRQITDKMDDDNDDTNDNGDDNEHENEEDESKEGDMDLGAGGIGLSLAFKSSNLLVSRGTSWVVSSATGAIFSAIYPGWGTLFGTQLGDGIVGAIMEG